MNGTERVEGCGPASSWPAQREVRRPRLRESEAAGREAYPALQGANWKRSLGHSDLRSVERYARLADQAVVDVLRTRKT